MSRILFITDSLFEYNGIQSLSAYLKENNHSVELSIYDNKAIKRVLSDVSAFKPDFLAFSVTSMNYHWALELSREVKKKIDVLSVFGGPHPTYRPDFIENDGVDIICIGEGEYPLLELAQNQDKGSSIAEIKNLWVKKNGSIYKNGLRPLIDDLDKLPFLDREIYYKKSKFLKNLTSKRFLVSRGCPYDCTYCHNHELRDMYLDKGRFVRFRSPDNIIREIKEVRQKYGLKSVSFCSDTFTLYPDLLIFLEAYKKEIGLPFFCQGRFNELNEEKIKKLKECGCIYIALGVESGSERIRNEILKRNMKDSQLIASSALLKKYKLQYIAYVMFGLPTETLAEAEMTMEFLARIGADKVAPTIYQPIENTKLFIYALDNKLLDLEKKESESSSHYAYASPVKLENKKEIFNLHKIAFIGVKYPRLIPFIKKIIKFPPNFIFRILNSYGLFNAYRLSRGMGKFEMIRLSWKIRKML